MFRLNLKAVGVVPKAELAIHEPTGSTPRPSSRRPVWFDADRGSRLRSTSAPTFRPAFRSTAPPWSSRSIRPFVIPPGTTAEVDQYLNIIIRVKE